MSGTYTYEKLVRSKREIRLVELLPGTHWRSKILPTCRISHTSLANNPKFMALSYVWGDANDKRAILVENRPFLVTRNLYDALLALRPEKESIFIWIDAICINQSDNEEKGWQVALMGDIYRQSSKVIAWLGAAADSSDSVIDYLNVLGEKAEACGLDRGPEAYAKIWRGMTATPPVEYPEVFEVFFADDHLTEEIICVSRTNLQHLLDTISGWQSQDNLLPMAGLKRLFLRPWWGRVWVLQEITLPKHAYFVCGTKQITRRRFSAAYNAYYAMWATLMLKLQQGESLSPYQMELQHMASHKAHVMLSMRRIHQFGGFPLVSLLRATCVGSIHHLQHEGHQHLDSTDPRDKIFALLCIATDREELKAFGVFPDYTKSKKEVYITTMAALLQQGHISLLSLCQFSETPRDLPSWVPDWTLPMIETLQDVKDDHLTLYPEFNASGSKPHQMSAVFSKREKAINSISIKANIYDTILEVGKVDRIPATGTCGFPSDWLFEILRLTYIAKDIYHSFDDRLRAVVRTSHAAIGYGEDAKLSRVEKKRFLDALPILKKAARSIAQRSIRMHLQSYLASKEVKQMMKSGAGVPSRLFHDFMRLSVMRSPFVTWKGHLGLSSLHVKNGDVVALICGAQVPFILRKHRDGQFTVVSEAYVDGIMDGEAMGNVQCQDIELM